MDQLSGLAVISVVGLMVLRGGRSGYDAFLAGARQSAASAAGLLPALCGMLMMLTMMQSSGLTALLTRLLAPLTGFLHLPEETAPMLLLRPVTGSGSLSVLQQIFEHCGPDSRAGRIASVLMGSSETILYTMTVYLSAAGLCRLPDVLWISLVSYLAGAWVCGIMM